MTAPLIPLVDAAPGPSSGDPASRVRMLAALLEELGITGCLVASKRLLEQERELNASTGEAKSQAVRRWAEHRERVLRGEVRGEAAVVETVAVRREVAPFLDTGPDGTDAASAMGDMWDLQRDCRGRAVAALDGEASGIYSRLRSLATQVVARTASLPPLPVKVWGGSDQAGTLAIQAGHELEWARLVGEATRFEKIHQAAAILRQSGGLPVMNFPGGAPTELAVLYRNWRPAQDGIAQLKRQPGPLRVRFAADQGWEPGCWLPEDHQPQPPRRSLVERLVGPRS